MSLIFSALLALGRVVMERGQAPSTLSDPLFARFEWRGRGSNGVGNVAEAGLPLRSERVAIEDNPKDVKVEFSASYQLPFCRRNPFVGRYASVRSFLRMQSEGRRVAKRTAITVLHELDFRLLGRQGGHVAPMTETIGGRAPAIVDSDRTFRVPARRIYANAMEFDGDISSQFAPRSLSSFPQRPNEKTGSKNAGDRRDHGPQCSISSGICGLPLGTKIAVTSILSLFAGPLIFGGIGRSRDFILSRRDRIYGVFQALAGLTCLLAIAGLWGWSGG